MEFILPAEDYYRDRPVPHTAQGDFYADVPCVFAIGKERARARGARKRPFGLLPGSGAPVETRPERALVVVCNYTCNFVAQPPGTQGYSHDFRQVAPVVPLVDLIGARGMQRTEARRLREVGHLSGLVYVPRPATVAAPEVTDADFTGDDFAILLYRMTTVNRSPRPRPRQRSSPR